MTIIFKTFVGNTFYSHFCRRDLLIIIYVFVLNNAVKDSLQYGSKYFTLQEVELGFQRVKSGSPPPEWLKSLEKTSQMLLNNSPPMHTARLCLWREMIQFEWYIV